MQPTWQTDDGRVKLWLADCLDVLPTLEAGSVDSVVTDPPWLARKDKITRRAGGVAAVVSPSQGIGYGSIGEFSAEALSMSFRACRHDMLVVCGYKELGQVIQVLEPIRGVFVWHKPNGGLSVAYPSPLDVAYVVWGAHVSRMTGFQCWKSGVMRHAVPSAGCISNGERVLVEPNGKAAHPCQGPLSLYEQLLIPNKGIVLDPFMGSGTCGVAAVRMGRQFWGIEKSNTKERPYFDMAVSRIKDELERMPLFEGKPTYRQAELVES